MLEKPLLARLIDSRIVKNTSVLLMAQIVSRALSVVYIAALARYIGAEGIGKISTATALTGLLILMVGPGLTTLFIRDVSVDLRKASGYVTNTFFIKAVLGIPFLAFAAIAASAIGYSPDTQIVVWMYALVYLLDTLGEVPVAVFRSYERMEYEAGSQIVRDAINVTLSLAAIHLRSSLFVIVLASVVAQAAKLVLMGVLVHRHFVRPNLTIDLRWSKALLITSMPFGGLLILNVLQMQLGTFALSIYRSATEVGVYSAAFSLIVILLLVPGTFSSAIFPTFSKMHVHARHELASFYPLTYKYLMVVGFPLGLGTILVGNHVIALIYGERFAGADMPIKILAVFLFTFVGYSNGPLLNAIGRQSFFAWTQAVAVGLNVLLCIVLIPRSGAIGASIAFVTPGLCTFVVHSVACHRFLGLTLPYMTTVRIALATVLMGFAVWAALSNGIPWFIAVFAIAPVVYGLSLLALRIADPKELRMLAAARGSRPPMQSEIPVG